MIITLLKIKLFKLTILLIESDLSNCYSIQKILERKGHQVAIILQGKPINNELLLHKLNELASNKTQE